MLDIEVLIANAESEPMCDIAVLIANATSVCERHTRNGAVHTRKMSKRELEAARKRPMRDYGPTLRCKELRRYQRPYTICAGVVNRLLKEATDADDYMRRLREHYGVAFSYDTIMRATERAYLRQEDTEVNV